MCNLYSLTANQSAIRQLFQTTHDRIGNLPPLPAIYPEQRAPIVRIGVDGQRELIWTRWGFPLMQKERAPKAVTNARSDKVRSSPFWKGSFETRRCLVPVTSFCEWSAERPKIPHWFGLQGDQANPSDPILTARPLFAFAGLWRRWRGVLKGEPFDGPVMAFLTTAANELVRPIHPKAMPVMLTEAMFDRWLTGTPDAAFQLTTPFPISEMAIVAKGQTTDGAGAE